MGGGSQVVKGDRLKICFSSDSRVQLPFSASCILLLFFLVLDAWIIGSIALMAGIMYYYSVKFR